MSKNNIDVVVSDNIKREKIILDMEGNEYSSLSDFKNGIIKQNGQNFTDNKENEETAENIPNNADEGVVRQPISNQGGEGGDKTQTTDEQIRLAVLNSSLSDKDKVFMTMLLMGKTKQESITAILTSPIKDTQKIELMKSI